MARDPTTPVRRDLPAAYGPQMDLGLAGQAFVVTGASRGLGLAGARALAAEGAHVVLGARDAEAVRRAADGTRAGRRRPTSPTRRPPPGSSPPRSRRTAGWTGRW